MRVIVIVIVMYTTISMASYGQLATAAADNGNGHQTQVPFPSPPDPHSGYLVFQDDEEETEPEDDSCCLGCFELDHRVRKLPFPQHKCLTIHYTDTYTTNRHRVTTVEDDRVYFIPVVGKSVSSNCYYVVAAEGKYKGLVVTCSKEEDMTTFCFNSSIKDIRPRPLESNNPYQQIEVIPRRHRFTSKCITSDGFPPNFLRRKDWTVEAKDAAGRLAYVRGENASLRAQTPPFNFSLWERRSPIVSVGEWYCPFIFIKEQGNRFEDPKIQLMETPFYKMDLQKFWEEIYSTEVGTREKDIFVVTKIRVEEALLLGSEAVQETRDDDGSVWMQENGKLKGVRLSWPIIAKIRADQGREGSEAIGRDERVNKLFSNTGIGKEFVCYVVVERYVLKRMDESVVLTYSFRYGNQINWKRQGK